MAIAVTAPPMQRPQLIAVGVSLAVHAVLLASLGGGMSRFDPDPVLVVTLMPEPPATALDVSVQATPQAAPRPEPEVAAPQTLPEPKAQPEPAAAREAKAREPQDAVPRIKSRPGIPPEIAQELSGRRLRVSLWVEGTGAVSQVDLEGNELSSQAIALLSESLAHARFTRTGRDTVLRTRLCFDDSGAVEGGTPECSILAFQK